MKRIGSEFCLANFNFNVTSIRHISKSRTNLYDLLGLTPKATQADVKAAYYKLSKQFHPDKNKNDESAADRFREITEAYEVLGNYRLRKLYDKGIVHTAGSQYSHHSTKEDRTQPYDDSGVKESDHITTKFYKSRLRDEHLKMGNSKIYDFDEWTAGHYGASMKKNAAGKIMRDKRADRQASYDDVMPGNYIVSYY